MMVVDGITWFGMRGVDFIASFSVFIKGGGVE